jgi:hypothetical protein
MISPIPGSGTEDRIRKGRAVHAEESVQTPLSCPPSGPKIKKQQGDGNAGYIVSATEPGYKM